MWSHRKNPSQPDFSADRASSTTRLGSANSAKGGRNRPNLSGIAPDLRRGILLHQPETASERVALATTTWVGGPWEPGTAKNAR